MFEDSSFEDEIEADFNDLVPKNGRDANFYVEEAERPCYLLVRPLNTSRILTYFWQVEDINYKLPLMTFTSNSALFKMVFSLPPAGEAEGSSESNPLVLNGVKRKDFNNLIQFLLRKSVSPSSINES